MYNIVKFDEEKGFLPHSTGNKKKGELREEADQGFISLNKRLPLPGSPEDAPIFAKYRDEP